MAQYDISRDKASLHDLNGPFMQEPPLSKHDAIAE
jgi:hypothetical protein